jgi:hypothetical protein
LSSSCQVFGLSTPSKPRSLRMADDEVKFMLISKLPYKSNPKYPELQSQALECSSSQLCSTGCSGNRSSTVSLSTHAFSGGFTISLKTKVPYTNMTKPTTCSHLNVSQPRPRDTIQMKRVRHVSIVERAVAETDRVTESPKKLNPLFRTLEPVT